MGQVLITRTVFGHSKSQDCGEGFPVSTGLTAWNASGTKVDHDARDFDVNDIILSMEGVASTRYMSVIYPYNMGHCQVHCPCSICSDLRRFQRKPCGELGWRNQAAICHQVYNNVQCKSAQVTHSKAFQSKEGSDHYSDRQRGAYLLCNQSRWNSL